MTIFDLTGKLALVTGAGSGLGRAFAQALSEFGATVICADREMGWAEESAALLRAAGAQSLSFDVDVADEARVTAMAQRLKDSFGRIDILINNAGIATAPARTHELAVADWDRLIAINLRGVFLCTRALLPLMLVAGGGSIISLASIIGLVGHYPDFASTTVSYATAKAGIIGLTRQVAAEYAADNIRANVIAPGWHGGTRLGDERRARVPLAEIAAHEEFIRKTVPMKRRGRPEELAGLAIYLASDASRYVTGQVFVQDGGWTAV